jgi:holo-[acyl-carrier protein] synthase
MILGIGIDIIDNRRIESVLNKYGDRFKKKCFTKNEIENSENKINKTNSYAKKYAAKEACAKALGTGISKSLFWKDIEIFNDDFGKPYIVLHNQIFSKLENLAKKNYKIEVSLSDEKNYSIANVIIQNE